MGFATKDAIAEVAGPQIGAQQILTGEASVKRELQVVVESGGVGQRHRAAGLAGELIRRSIHAVGSGVDGSSRKGVGPHHKSGQAGEFCCGGKLSGGQLSHPGLHPVNTAPEQRQLPLKLLDQALELVGHLGDAIEAGIE